jgi:diguanylate cyclase (GGDEF)-like protein/putative nucleotidyltransferase with HDIG domain
MGDVFTILALTQFGPGPALILYCLGMIVGHFAHIIRRDGIHGVARIKAHKVLFNLACCGLSVWLMNLVYRAAIASTLPSPQNLVAAFIGISLTWFLVNTVTLSLAVSFWSNQTFWTVWREGVTLALLNFTGSAAAAGLISFFYKRAGFFIFLLSLPIAVVVYQLYRFYVERYEQAQAHISELSKLYLQTVEALSSAVDAKDRYTHGHIRRVQAYATELAKFMGINDDNELLAIRAGALLHDIGKIAIPEYILNKPTVLTETEFEKMKIHPVVGADMLSSIEFPYPVLPIVKYHHERWDGNGYPDGLKGSEIPLNARILSLVDCYDALTTNRPYRSPMARPQIVDFFQREAGRAYDPVIVQRFIENLERIEGAGNAVAVRETDVWAIREVDTRNTNARKLESVQPTVAYGKALSAGPEFQRELYSVFEFARADFQCLTPKEIFSFMGSKLEKLVDFDTALFYLADLTEGFIVAEHFVGETGKDLLGLSLALEQKLTGWVAANNQSLCNLPPFPDFLKCSEPRPTFQLSAIAPLNRHGEVLGAISLYRREQVKFTEEEFRRLEIIASQTAIIVAKCGKGKNETPLLLDPLTGLPNVFQLYLMFEQIAMDAGRYEYPLALLSISLDDIAGIRRKWGPMSGDEAVRASANYLRNELRETDLLVLYAGEEFVALNPKITRDQAEALKSRLQDELDHFRFLVRPDSETPLRVSIGIAIYPEDGVELEGLLSTAERSMHDDKELRSAIRRRIRTMPAS